LGTRLTTIEINTLNCQVYANPISKSDVLKRGLEFPIESLNETQFWY